LVDPVTHFLELNPVIPSCSYSIIFVSSVGPNFILALASTTDSTGGGELGTREENAGQGSFVICSYKAVAQWLNNSLTTKIQLLYVQTSESKKGGLLEQNRSEPVSVRISILQAFFVYIGLFL
jgi:hypothetical protein